MKTYHEAPISIFEKVQELTDGDYALVHLLESNLQYLGMFQKAIADGRDVILDNSIFELGTAFDGNQYANWIKEVKPTWYIVPDVWKNSYATITKFFDFLEKHPGLPGKIIGVAQGLGFEDTAHCYRAIEPYCDKIAFNLDGSEYFYKCKGYPATPKCVAMSYGRSMLIQELFQRGVINPKKPHHLLGCGVPQEMKFYRDHKYGWIDSVDTSNPVMHGLCDTKYDYRGVDSKPEGKMCDLMDYPVTGTQWSAIAANIGAFRGFCNG